MLSEIILKTALPEDAGRLLEIYAPYVLKTSITFEYDVPSVTDFRERIHTVLNYYPYLTASVDGIIRGFAYAGPFHNRAAYAWSAETTVYVEQGYAGIGIGSLLYRRLEDLLKAQNTCTMCACIAYPNPESIRFHRQFGFKKAAHFHHAGYKFNKWHDIIWMEKSICEYTCTQKPVIPAKEVL